MACDKAPSQIYVTNRIRAGTNAAMTELLTNVTDSAALPEEAFEWGSLKWLCNGKICPGAAQTIGICHIRPGQRNPVHYHPNCEEVLYMLSGEGEHSFDG